MIKKILVSGGNGFIGQNFLSKLENKKYEILNIDCLTESADKSVNKRLNWIKFKKINLCDTHKIEDIFSSFKPDIVVNFAAHSHVDNSIVNSRIFLENINGTYNLLQSSLKTFQKKRINFLQISTDEVFGSIKKGEFNSLSAYRPNSPYSATKAASDHLVRAFHKTYGLPTAITFSCNNYGPYQHLEKLIPLTISSFLSSKKMGIYGNGNQKRQWIYIDDNIDAIKKVLLGDFDGSTHCIGSQYEVDNLTLVKKIIRILHKKMNLSLPINYFDYIKFVKDRPGHDLRYFLNYKNFSKKFSWKQNIDLNTGLDKTVNWYLMNPKWIKLKKNFSSKFF